jgi:hypothetical protein
VCKFILGTLCDLFYNLFINRKEPHMTDREFFTADQEQWYCEFVDAEVSEIVEATHTHREFFEFDDVPF